MSQSTSDYLVPARIAADLTPKRRKNLGIAPLDAEGLEALLEANLDVIAQLEPTAPEREAFLLTGVSDDLLRRLPIHVRSDGTTGNAVGAYREADWPIPAALRAHVRTIERCANAEAWKTQQRIIPAWSSHSQLDEAVRLAEPHRFQRVILDALAQMAAAKTEPQPSLKEALCGVPWLAAAGQPIAPQYVLALPPAVDDAAHALVLEMGVSAPFVPVLDLPADIRGHPGFAYLDRWMILPDKCSSFEALALMIEEWKPIGRLGPSDGYPVADFTVLAAAGADLRLPGWPLLSAALINLEGQPDLARRTSVAFASVDASDPETAARHLDSLATLAEEHGPASDAARRAYMHGFAMVAGWPEEARRVVFGATRVPTRGGGWRAGSEVVPDGDGISATHMLSQDCAAMLRKQGGSAADTHDSGSTSAALNAVRPARRDLKTVDPANLDTQSAMQHRKFLQRWRGRVPSDLVITYIGMIGRTKPFKDLAKEWRADATADVETLWTDLDRHFPPSVLVVPLTDEIEQRRFVIEEVAGERVSGVAMSGDVFEAPLGAGAEGIVIGNLHRAPERIRTADGQWRLLITLKLRPVDLAGRDQRESRRLFRELVATVASDCLGLIMSNQQTALQRILDKAGDVPQAMLDETEHLLRDRLPTVLAELKLPADCSAQQALRAFQHGESRLQRLSVSAEDVERLNGLEQLKADLWRAVSDPQAAADLLTAVRSKIEDFGYSAGRILFELFQNADDAYRQQGAAQERACFRVDIASKAPKALRVIHWGRPINYLGLDAAAGRRAGYDRDLLNMLLMNFSEKRHGEETTGKFGLGFKSVHLLSDSVGIASGFIALRTVGGFVPAQWPQGPDVSEGLRRADGRTATVIDIPFSRLASDASAEAVQTFRAALPWLPAFTHTIRRVEVTGDDPVTIECSSLPLAVVRFGAAIEQVLRSELADVPSLHTALRDGTIGDAAEAVAHAQSLAIASVNDQWGVFSRSRVQLLPHQLWVCRKVNQEWPFRWLVADDVGLGKTIECGLALMPLIASGRARRVLILAPAKLVPQWQFRLKDLFDIRLQRYVSEADTQRGDFWATASMVVASFHTLRDDRRGARRRLLDADPWDLVIVDEAHHLGIDKRTGETLAYGLVSELETRDRINSLLFFTGTTHRGKDYGFFGLMRLVRPHLFDPEGDKVEQLAQLPKVMIRNNKATVTDLQGNRLFKPVSVHSREYAYSADEARFYDTLSSFILDGRAYAATLDGRAQTARMLVLIALQKLAASSIAAIRSALRKRRTMLADAVGRPDAIPAILPDDEQTLDDAAEAEEALPGFAGVLLMKDEIRRLDELIALSETIARETKIERLLEMIRSELPAHEPVLLFTEYKATQALVINALHRRLGFSSARFINGDERLDGLEQPGGTLKTVSQPREQAADAFNAGKVRFLVSTEAGGEGIDLQERCALLVHVDMPWNPMRLHQRVGRLHRYGQKQPVAAYILRNPDTVEARIWDLLTEKLERVQMALSSVMEEREDISQLVVGMAGSSFFNELFAGAQGVAGERLGAWFDQASATLGGRDVVETVRELLGNVARFDFQQVGKDLPKVDLPDLERFFTHAASRHARRIFRRDNGLEIKTPDAWRKRSYALRDKYEGLVFDRSLRGTNAASRVLGIGHPLFDIALEDARDLSVRVACTAGLATPLLIASVEDEVTGTGALVHRLIFGVTEENGNAKVLRDWELLQVLNALSARGSSSESLKSSQMKDVVNKLKRVLDADLTDRAPTFRKPSSWPEMLLLPAARTELT